VTSPTAAGTNGLLAAGAAVVRDAQDVLDQLFGLGVRKVEKPRIELPVPQRRLLDAIAAGQDTEAALIRAGFSTESLLADLASLELEGHIVRHPEGRLLPRA
jgi:predicted Rossmann fold nucleotide-binding protein DprA/Smf involved in DNA uptake